MPDSSERGKAGESFPPSGRAPLEGVLALVTRAAYQARKLQEPLASLGARVILTPAIRFEDPPDWAPADAALREVSEYDWVLFTSVNGVEAVSSRLEALGLGWDGFRRPRLGAIGPATARALETRGLEVAVVPERFQAEGILDALGTGALEGKRVLIARAERAREILPDEIRRRGALVDLVPVYRTVATPPSPEAVEVLTREIGSRVLITFTSASTVEHFIEGLPLTLKSRLGEATIAAIGPITAEALAGHGLVPAIQPELFTIPALVDAIRAHFTAHPIRIRP